MMIDREAVLTGGCQCGTVRFAAYAQPVRVGLCHCRMCQKAVGAPFISLALIKSPDFAWTRGKPATYRSSSIAEREFCGTCGTPLSYRALDGEFAEITTGSFDRPDLVVPTYAVGSEGQLEWVSHIGGLPGKTTAENMGSEKLAKVVSHQHADRAT